VISWVLDPGLRHCGELPIRVNKEPTDVNLHVSIPLVCVLLSNEADEQARFVVGEMIGRIATALRMQLAPRQPDDHRERGPVAGAATLKNHSRR
jgi:hypothetical protein